MPKNGTEAFYHEIKVAKAEKLAKNLVTHNFLRVSNLMSHRPRKNLPTTFVHRIDDKAIEIDLQTSMVENAIEAGGAIRLTTGSLGSSHTPFLSRPAAVVDLVT